MSGGVFCVWANLPEEVTEWYENDFLPTQDHIDALHTIQCEIASSGMENEPVGKLDAPWPWLTVYEVKDVAQTNKEVDVGTKNIPEVVKNGPLKHVHFDARSYHELKRWQDNDWEGSGSAGKKTNLNEAHPRLMPPDIEHVASIAAMEWTMDDDKEEEVLKYYCENVGPVIYSSPDVLRFRLFKLDRASVVDKNQKTTVLDNKNLHKYFTLVELASEEWPWDVVVELAEKKGWKDYFETQTVAKWQLSHYTVRSSHWKGKEESSAS
ncbi:hypothetical protein COCC4DRAFT_64027 [Bipolaris maydis ATCC 48331]|uniref:Uncharacterized protein n=2 Tax=Cochliobolus heterostrophus TaxID=5016 RepID=M2SL58_COCH5|nr:uncharacterized protein COCC4DRAFT_64027 [Bipolaris maydis ATCC 48331]EMD86065.1 hypothetical protein COCHEDRAFT_1035126 [Bipolaris maydis C5]KAH7562777.1 hypothetical protein BM1_02297 [Bipolaris maydis]ENI02068.1 hypothetical protein COCC4DRAFT_64027 [Bipolaris maydis ATCC 48331]KAJ5028164.1 hypothetical protein J3E73DRAFT_38383 [Bipolaris maydis]KAJ5062940.1 hypothetical protein J3E74DRAFT_34620 [Bipolaris maydis]